MHRYTILLLVDISLVCPQLINQVSLTLPAFKIRLGSSSTTLSKAWQLHLPTYGTIWSEAWWVVLGGAERPAMGGAISRAAVWHIVDPKKLLIRKKMRLRCEQPGVSYVTYASTGFVCFALFSYCRTVICWSTESRGRSAWDCIDALPTTI